MSNASSGKAIVAHGPVGEGKWKIENVKVRPPRDNELVVQIVASGICHTDLHFGGQKDGFGVCYPRVLGHEGAGYVKQVGSNVTVAQPGDPVLLSYSSCGQCPLCTSGHPAHCVDFNDLNFGATTNFSIAGTSAERESSTEVQGSFFGQSSFASMTIANESSVVNVKGIVNDENELKLFAPLGCGIQTGSGTIVNVANATEDDAVVVTGLGGVGLSGIIGAKLKNCKTIIGIDRVESRLALAKELGATHVFNTAGMASLDELVDEVKQVTDGLGATIAMDTTGSVALMTKALDYTRFRGKIMNVASVPIEAKLEIPIALFMMAGKQYIGAIEGDAIPSKYVPEMIKWYREGKFPVDRLAKFFKAEDYQRAIEEMHTGETIKPVIVW